MNLDLSSNLIRWIQTYLQLTKPMAYLIEVIFGLEKPMLMMCPKLDKDITVAQQQTDESVRQILALARRYNVAAEDLKTDYISVDMLYSTNLVDDEDNSAAREKKVKREFLGYSVSVASEPGRGATFTVRLPLG